MESSQTEKKEKVQMRATKLVLTAKHLTYKERLRQLNLPTLKYRRTRGDMIEVLKLLTGKYDTIIFGFCFSFIHSFHCKTVKQQKLHRYGTTIPEHLTAHFSFYSVQLRCLSYSKSVCASVRLSVTHAYALSIGVKLDDLK